MYSESFTTPRGSRMLLAIRGDTNDGALAKGLLETDEYRLAELPDLSGWALDIGAHVGTVAIALAVDHPSLQVIAVEPVPDNAALIRHSVTLNGLNERVFVEEAAAGSGVGTVACHYGYTQMAGEEPFHVEQNRYIGNMWGAGNATTVEVRLVTLEGLARKYSVDHFAFCKIDCEGCEYDFLDGAKGIDRIVGERHGLDARRIERLLSSFQVEWLEEHGGTGLFRAVA